MPFRIVDVISPVHCNLWGSHQRDLIPGNLLRIVRASVLAPPLSPWLRVGTVIVGLMWTFFRYLNNLNLIVIQAVMVGLLICVGIVMDIIWMFMSIKIKLILYQVLVLLQWHLHLPQHLLVLQFSLLQDSQVHLRGLSRIRIHL